MSDGIKDYLRDGFEVKSSHVDMHGNHWLVMQKSTKIVMVKLPISVWTGKPTKGGQSEECWEIEG